VENVSVRLMIHRILMLL